MPTRMLRRQITPRDVALFAAIDRHPFTAEQLLTLSETFPSPFTHERLLRRRLHQLADEGLVRSWPLATVSRGGSPHYWKLTRPGFGLLQGEDAPRPGRRFFEPIAPGNHHHTRCLGDFLTHTIVTAHRRGIGLRHFAPENSVELKAGDFVVRPDCAFQLRTPDGRAYHFCVELDNGTERVRSRLDVESIERKLRGYDAHQAQFDALNPHRYLVLFVTTRSKERLEHILNLAASIMQNPQRTVFIGVTLEDFLASADPFQDAVITDHRQLKRMMLPRFGNAQPASSCHARQMNLSSVA